MKTTCRSDKIQQSSVLFKVDLNVCRLVDLASSVGKGPEAKDVLFRKTYELGQNVSSLDVLIEAGRELEIPGVEDYLVSDFPFLLVASFLGFCFRSIGYSHLVYGLSGRWLFVWQLCFRLWRKGSWPTPRALVVSCPGYLGGLLYS